MRKEVQLQVERGVRMALHDRREVMLQLGAGENPDGIARDLLQYARLSCAQIPAGQLVIPGAVGELRDGSRVNLLDIARHAILFQVRGEALIEPRISRIAVDLRAINTQRLHRPFERGESREILVQHLHVFA